MDVKFDLNYLDCIKDSPSFRKNINISYIKVVNYQDVITEISEAFSQSVKSGIIFSCHYQTLCSKIEKLIKLYNDTDSFQVDLSNIIKIFIEYKDHLKNLVENFQSIQKDFKLFMDEFKEIELCKKYFQKASDQLDISQQKCSASSKFKSNDNIDADNQCSVARQDFMAASLRHFTSLEKFEIHKNSLFLKLCINIIKMKCDYYSQGDESMNKLAPWIEQLKTSKSNYDNLYERKLFQVNDVVSNLSGRRNSVNIINIEPNSVIEGYLYKCPRKAWQRWQRRWFKICDNQLLSCKRTDDNYSIVETDLRICTAKELVDIDRRFCFVLIGVNHSTILQADDDVLQKKWIECLRSGLSAQVGTLKKHAENSTDSLTFSDRKSSCSHLLSANAKDNISCSESEERKNGFLSHVLDVKGNDFCCDCNDSKPRWTSSSLGITLCQECSGAHRSLGVHISKVRSLSLDNWEPEMLVVMLMLGNELINKIFESDKKALEVASKQGIKKPDSTTDMNMRKLWIKYKYEKKQFVHSNVQELLTNLQMYIVENRMMLKGSLQDGYVFTTASDLLRYGIELQCLPLMMLGLSLKASPNGNSDDYFIPLHLAASSDFWQGCEFLILNGAKIDIVDKDNETALHKACQKENVLAVWLLLKRGARQNIRDSNGMEVLQIAMNTTNANTVTLLRLQMLNENTKEAELGSSGDETVNDVFRYFTNRAFDQIDEWLFSNNIDSVIKVDDDDNAK